MNQYQPPSTNPAKEHHVAGANLIEINEQVHNSAKLQNKLRWLLVIITSILGFFLASYFINTQNALTDTAIRFIVACLTGVIGNKFITKILPLADMTSTVKFKKFGNDLRIKKATKKSQLK